MGLRKAAKVSARRGARSGKMPRSTTLKSKGTRKDARCDRRLRAQRPSSGENVTTAVQVTLGVERCHPEVWRRFREHGLIHIAGHDAVRWRKACKFLIPGHRILLYAPKKQGGTGLLGMGTIVTSPVKCEEAGKWIDGVPDGELLQRLMREAFCTESSDFKFKKSCFSKGFKYFDSWQKTVGALTPAIFAKRWASKEEWTNFHHSYNPKDKLHSEWHATFRVQWGASSSFHAGVSSIDWVAHAVPHFCLSALHALTPRKVQDSQWAVMKTELSRNSSQEDGSIESSGSEKGINTRVSQVSPSGARLDHNSDLVVACVASGSDTGIKTSGSPVPSARSLEQDSDPLAAFLGRLSLGHYLATFKSEEVDMATLHLLSDADLLQLGLTLGARRKIQASLPRAA